MTQADQATETPEPNTLHGFIVFYHKQPLTASPQKHDTQTLASGSKTERLAFPVPKEPQKTDSFFCPTDYILKLYNKQFRKSQKRFTHLVKDWFEGAAYKAGWTEVEFLESYQTSRIDGCRLSSRKPNEASHAQTH